MKRNVFVRTGRIASATLMFILSFHACEKPETKVDPPKPKPKAGFTFTVVNQGQLPAQVKFTSSSTETDTHRWDFGNGTYSTEANPSVNYAAIGSYSVKLVASNQHGSDSVTQQVDIRLDKPKPDFTFQIRNQGFLPDTVTFTSTSIGATKLKWSFGDGKTDSVVGPINIYQTHGTFNVKLVATNAGGSDSITKSVQILLNKPVARFTYVTTNLEFLPVSLYTMNTTTGSNVTHKWTVENTTIGLTAATSTQKDLATQLPATGIYSIKLLATNAAGSDSVSQTLRVSPFPQPYQSFDKQNLNLYSWEGEKVTMLTRNISLNRVTMFKWLKAMDMTYDYYKLCTGRDPIPHGNFYINGRATIADVPSTCGAGCGYLGFTGIEIQNSYFDVGYNAIHLNNQFDQVLFYEFGRNFWFYGNQLAYKANDPVTTGYAVFMRFLAMDAAGVNGAPFGPWTFAVFRSNVEGLVNQYLANTSLNWANTLGIGQGVPGSGLGGADLFASFCFRLMRDHGGQNFIQNLWKRAGQRPTAATTQDAVDNFFLAACAAANKNLTTVFQQWRWPLSTAAISAATQYP